MPRGEWISSADFRLGVGEGITKDPRGDKEDGNAFENTGRNVIEEEGPLGSSMLAAVSLHETPGTGLAPVCTVPSCAQEDVTN